MADVLRIKRRTSGAPGAPTSLANAELAYNEVDHTLYYGEGTGGAGGSATTVVPIAGQGLGSNTVPTMDGTGAAGTGSFWSRFDHVHPTDTSRAPSLNPAFITNGGSLVTVRPQADPGTPNYLTGTLLGLATNTGGLRLTFCSAGGGGNNVLTSLMGGNTLASLTATPGGQNLFLLSAGGYDGTSWQGGAAQIGINADTTWSATNRSCTMQFIVTSVGSTAQTEAMRINSSAQLLIGATTPVGAEKLRVNGTINATNLTGLPTTTVGTTDATSKSYVDTKITNLGTIYLPLSGGEITGNLIVDGTVTSSSGLTVGDDLLNTALFRVNGQQGNNRGFVLQTVSKNRWSVYANQTNESTGNVGSDFVIQNFNDAGTQIATPLTITRSTGVITTSSKIVVGAAPTANMDVVNKQFADTTYLALAGGTMTGALTLNADPVNPLHAATRQYVDNAIQGLDVKASVRVATTGSNITLSGPQTIDNISLSAGDRVLVKDQTLPANNGIYIVAGGAWTRALDMDNWLEVPGSYVFVESGTVNADSGWVCTSDPGGTISTTAITWSQFSGAGQIIAGNGLTKTGNQIDVVGTTNRITVAADSIDIASTYAGQATINTLGTVTVGTWNGTVVGVPYGGTGVGTLTGYVKGAGTAPFTAVAQIPNTDVSGLGTMSIQNATSVAITGGSIDNITFDMGTF